MLAAACTSDARQKSLLLPWVWPQKCKVKPETDQGALVAALLCSKKAPQLSCLCATKTRIGMAEVLFTTARRNKGAHALTIARLVA